MKWEYCAVIGIQSAGRTLYPRLPAIWYFTASGVNVTEIKGQEVTLVAQTITQLGEQGWEMVGCGPMAGSSSERSAEITHAIYFKRPKP